MLYQHFFNLQEYKMNTELFDKVTLTNIFEQTPKGVRISKHFSDHLITHHDVFATQSLNDKGDVCYYWNRLSSLPLSRDAYIRQFVNSFMDE